MNRKERRAKQKADKRSGIVSGSPDIGTLLNQAIQQHQIGNLAPAVEIYRQILSMAPDNADTLNLYGLAYHQEGDHEKACELIGKAITISPMIALYHNNLAMALHGSNRSSEATASLRQAVTLDSSYIDAWVNLGDVLDHLGQTDASISAYQSALQLAPEAAYIHFQLAKCYSANGERTLAISSLRRATTLEPNFVDVYERLGSLLCDNDEPHEALKVLQKAQALEPNNGQVWFTTGRIQRDLDQPENALSAFEKTIQLLPNLAEAHHNMGGVLRDLGRGDDAIAAYNRALAIDPNRQDTRSDRALALLAAGQFAAGWQDFQVRASTSDNRNQLHLGPLPDDLDGKNVLVLRDQGLGDELFFLRFVPALKARGATVIYQGQSQLISLVKRLDFLDVVLDENLDNPPPAVDYCVSAGDLPAALGMTSKSKIPPSITLSVLPAPAAKLAKQLQEFGPAPYFGVTWRAGIQKRNRLSKIAPMQALASSLSGLDATFVAMQRNPEPGELEQFAAQIRRPILDLTDLNNDLEAMLALLYRLDSYVCVSNTNTHLSAALGKPCHVLVPNPADYRWMNRGDISPWFPDYKIYRENYQAGWEAALNALSKDLVGTYSN